MKPARAFNMALESSGVMLLELKTRYPLAW